MRKKSDRAYKILVTLLCTGLLLHGYAAREACADQYIGCFKVGAGLVDAASCPGCNLMTVQIDINPVIVPYCPDGFSNDAIAYLKCASVPDGETGRIVCNYQDQIVGLKYKCKEEMDWTGIETALAGLGLLTVDCAYAIAGKNVPALITCIAGTALFIAVNSGCTYKKCVADPYVSSPIVRSAYQSLGTDTCQPGG